MLEHYGAGLKADKVDVQKPFFWCDVAQALRFSRRTATTRRLVLGAVSALLDLVRALGIKMDERRCQAAHGIANYCTMNKDPTKYLEKEGDYSSRELVDAILWCVGAVAVKARIV